MDTPQHDSRDRIRIAEVIGALPNLNGKLARDEITWDAAVAELRAITTDQHLLSHGLAARLNSHALRRLAVAAGADEAEARAIHASMHPPRGDRNVADLGGRGNLI